MTDLEFIQKYLTRGQLWGQLAEECTELAQACLKMQRLCQGRNLPRKDATDCISAVIEEHADVELCFEVLGWNDKTSRENVKEYKLQRWANLMRKELVDGEV